ncbi:hypothetical protein [Mucilaginibacter sp. PPCGB 2223]|uniref:hypothetical protein n=1 Tax=Mucilaginibacter sp. PPCGB 2223 TaxID=1886027 RepID=UPI001111A4F4|nr:hypothetical protein [Mucilaginibacter sp. PPCGB 2223]
MSAKFKPYVSIDTGYVKSVNSYLKRSDSLFAFRSVITKKDSMLIDGKKAMKFSGERKSERQDEFKDYLPRNFDLLVIKNPPYVYMVYFEDDLRNDDIEQVKRKLYSSIKITEEK